MYGVEGERDLTEHTLEHLAGYRASAPVRVGNDAWTQTQLDVVGEVLDAAHLLKDRLLDGRALDPGTCELLVALADRAAAGWQEPDAGMWEARDGRADLAPGVVVEVVERDDQAPVDPGTDARDRLDVGVDGA